MSKKDDVIIAGADCKGCKYFDDNIINNTIICEAKNKKYYYGQCIPCDDREEEKK